MLNVSALNAGYGQSQVLHDLSFSVGPDEILAIMGRNGMGKTTLLKTLIGLLPARSGVIRLGDRDIGSLPSHERVRAGLAYVPQGRLIFPALTVTENILAGARGVIEKSAWDEITPRAPEIGRAHV